MHIGLNAHLLSSRAGYRTAGIHGYIYNTLAHLSDVAPVDWRFTALVGAANSEEFPGITMRRAALDTESPMRRIIWEQLIQPWQLNEFDLYHALAFIAPLRMFVPSVVTVYDLSFVHYPAVLTASRRLYLRLFTRLTCQRARRVIAISQSTARDLTATFDIKPDKIDVAAPGYNTRFYRPLPDDEVTAFRYQQGLPERFWFFMGTLEPRKNLVMLLEAYAALSPADRLPLVLGGGKGWLYDDIFATIERYNLQGDVRWLGFLPAEELPFWYNSAELFLFPSVFEGFGLPVLEAMACGTPVLVSNTSSLPEIAAEAGLCLPPHDVDAWTAALRQVRHDREWREQARQKGLLEAQRFTWEQTAHQTLRSYECSLNIKRQ